MNLAIGEPSKTSLLRQGKMIAATVVPRKVTAITSVASSARVLEVEDVVGVQEGDDDRRDHHQHQGHDGRAGARFDGGDPLGQHAVESRRKDHPCRAQEDRARPAEPPQAHQQDDQELDDPALDHEGREERRVRPERQRWRFRGVAPGVIPEGAIGIVIEIPAQGLGDQGEEDQRQDRGDDHGGSHTPEIALVVGGAAYLTV